MSAAINELASRIDAEFSAMAEKVEKFKSEQLQEYKERQQRVERLEKRFDELKETWKPRLEYLIKTFGGRVQATPRIVPSTREGIFEFQSSLARVTLKFSAYTDRDVRKVILGYDLNIIPVLMRFQPHSEIEFPLDAVDHEAAGRWMDERIVEFVRVYLSMGENEWYLKDQMVEDPVANVRFPKQAAGAQLDWNGRTYYFLGDETKKDFMTQNKISTNS